MTEKIRLSPKQRMVLRAFACGRAQSWRTVVEVCRAEGWRLARQRALVRTALCLADHGLLDHLEVHGGERAFQLTQAGRVALHAATTRRETAPPSTTAVKGRGPTVAVSCCRHRDCQQLRAAALMDEGDNLGALAIIEQDAAVFCARRS